ncbi:CopD family protein [Ornithinimicrobium sp. Arc0846-15]|nr:CopD family protein [Ornithinimicrobium laminariae]
MNPDLLPLALGINRVILYSGYVLLAGTFTFWSLVWPQGRKDRHLLILSIAGIALTTIATVAGPMIDIWIAGMTWAEVFSPISAAALFVRLAALAAAAFFLVDIVNYPIASWRRALPLTIVVAIAATMVASSNAVGGPWEVVKLVATMGHVIATAAWLGGLVALAAVLIPRQYLAELDKVIPRFSIIAATSVVVLLVTGTLHALAIAGGFQELVTSDYGIVFFIKVAIFGAMLLMGNHGRKYANGVALRAAAAARASKEAKINHDKLTKGGPGMHSLAVAMGAELAIAFGILLTTSLLVFVAPH